MQIALLLQSTSSQVRALGNHRNKQIRAIHLMTTKKLKKGQPVSPRRLPTLLAEHRRAKKKKPQG
jgi:hypothetical protein